MAEYFSSKKIGKELSKQFSCSSKKVRVRMKYSIEVGRFMDKLRSARKSTKNSELVFK